ADRSLATHLIHGVHGGTDVAEIPGIDDQLDVSIVSRKALQDFHGAIGGAVVDEEVFVTIAPQAGHYFADPGIHLCDISLLVVTGRENADAFHDVRPVNVPALARPSRA